MRAPGLNVCRLIDEQRYIRHISTFCCWYMLLSITNLHLKHILAQSRYVLRLLEEYLWKINIILFLSCFINCTYKTKKYCVYKLHQHADQNYDDDHGSMTSPMYLVN